MPSKPDTSAAPATRNQGLLFAYGLAVCVLVGSLLLVLLSWRNAQERALRDAGTAFRIENAQALESLRQRLVNYELLVRGGSLLQASLARPSQLQWRSYADGLRVAERFPALEAFGFAARVDGDERVASVRELLFASRMPVPDAGAARTDRQAGPHALVLYTEPQSAASRRLVGVDLTTLEGHGAVLRSAATSGVMGITPPFGASGSAAGTLNQFSLVAPVYAAGTLPSSNAARSAALRGWIFARIRSDRFVSMALSGLPRKGLLRIVDAGSQPARTIYSDSQFLVPAANRSTASKAPAFVEQSALQAFGRDWRLEFQSVPLARVKRDLPGLSASLLVGILAALMLSGIAFSLARTQARAQRLAARMSDSYRRSELRFRSAMKYSAIGKALLDSEGRIVDANPALLQILGASEQALIGTAFGAHFASGQDDTIHTAERQAVAEGAYRTNRLLARSDGDLRNVGLTFAAVPGDSGDGVASLVQVQDITERLRAEARVHALNRTLEARVALRTRELSVANQELESFAYSVSHDLRAPLRSIDGFSKLLVERYAAVIDDSGRDYLGRIRNATIRMGDLIDAMLKMSRVSRGALKQEHVDLGRIAMDVGLELRGGDPAREVAFEIAPGLQVEGDPSLLRNLMENLIGNAWKFTRGRDGARIEVGLNREGEFFVRDNGAGFASEYSDKLFRPFQRLHTEEQYAGHGIGLASVKRIVDRHGGSIRAEGSPGRGATFFFRLPPPEPDHD